MKIYTRGGDRGRTSILGGKRILKSDLRLEVYGSIDELNSLVGIAANLTFYLPDIQNELYQLQHYLYDCGNDFATPIDSGYQFRLNEELVIWLEERIDDYSESLPPINQFILPSGTHLASHLHYARTLTRRVERLAVAFMQEEEINEVALKFLNRLSDYFFVLARYANKKAHVEDVFYQGGSFSTHSNL